MSITDNPTLRAQTERFLRIAQFGHTARGLAWKPPLVTYFDIDQCQEYVAEWYIGDKVLSVWFDGNEIYYIKSTLHRLDDGYLTCPQDLSRLMVWLLCEPESVV